MWRPDDWPKNPCDDCPDKNEDQWGLFCDIACGEHTAWLNHEAGANAILEALYAEVKGGWCRLEKVGNEVFVIWNLVTDFPKNDGVTMEQKV